jgi:hypothetical protein
VVGHTKTKIPMVAFELRYAATSCSSTLLEEGHDDPKSRC